MDVLADGASAVSNSTMWMCRLARCVAHAECELSLWTKPTIVPGGTSGQAGSPTDPPTQFISWVALGRRLVSCQSKSPQNMGCRARSSAADRRNHFPARLGSSCQATLLSRCELSEQRIRTVDAPSRSRFTRVEPFRMPLTKSHSCEGLGSSSLSQMSVEVGDSFEFGGASRQGSRASSISSRTSQERLLFLEDEVVELREQLSAERAAKEEVQRELATLRANLQRENLHTPRLWVKRPLPIPMGMGGMMPPPSSST